MYLLSLYLFLFLLVAFPVLSKAKDRAENSPVVSLTPEHREILTYGIRGVELQLPEKIYLKNNQVDFSAVIQELKRTTESDYDNTFDLENTNNSLFYVVKRELCSISANPRHCEDKAQEDLDNALEEISQKNAGRILYPVYYKPARLEKGVSENIIQQALQDLDCNNCGLNLDTDAVLISSQDQYQQFYDKLKTKSSKCQRSLFTLLAHELQRNNIPKACTKQKKQSTFRM